MLGLGYNGDICQAFSEALATQDKEGLAAPTAQSPLPPPPPPPVPPVPPPQPPTLRTQTLKGYTKNGHRVYNDGRPSLTVRNNRSSLTPAYGNDLLAPTNSPRIPDSPNPNNPNNPNLESNRPGLQFPAFVSVLRILAARAYRSEPDRETAFYLLLHEKLFCTTYMTCAPLLLDPPVSVAPLQGGGNE